MADKKKELEPGMYNVVFTDKLKHRKGDKEVYHSSTAQILADKGVVEVKDKIEEYIPKGAKK